MNELHNEYLFTPAHEMDRVSFGKDATQTFQVKN